MLGEDMPTNTGYTIKDGVYVPSDMPTYGVTVEAPAGEEGPPYDPNWSTLPEGPMGPPSSLANLPWWLYLILGYAGYKLLSDK